ncbi:unnamed protein product [Camellia sinensis]
MTDPTMELLQESGWEELKKEARKIEGDLDIMLSSYGNLGSRFSMETLERNASIEVRDAKIIFNGCQCTAQHAYRKGNLCADALAKLGTAQPEDILVVNDPSAEIKKLLVADMLQLGRERV